MMDDLFHTFLEHNGHTELDIAENGLESTIMVGLSS